MNITALRRTVARCVFGLVVCAALVTLCYYVVDRPVAFYVHNHGWNKVELFKWLTYPPPIVQTWSPLVLALLVLRRASGKWTVFEHTLFVALLSLIVADQVRYGLGELFGRYWPETWFNNNPSLIGNGTYGFHPFRSDDEIGSFPSGHTARIVGFCTPLWIGLPKWRWLYVLVAVPMIVSLVLMDYHFVGDVVAGCYVGIAVGAVAMQLSPCDGVRLDKLA